MGDPLLLATVESFVSRVNDDRPLLHGEGALFSRDAAFAKLNRVSQIRGPAHQKGGVGNQPIALATGLTDAPICDLPYR